MQGGFRTRGSKRAGLQWEVFLVVFLSLALESVHTRLWICKGGGMLHPPLDDEHDTSVD